MSSIDIKRPNYDYPSDGIVRRVPHEYGLKEYLFYQESLKRMDYRPEDVAIDIGAGLAHDGLRIATEYGPLAVYMLEPSDNKPGEPVDFIAFDNKFFHLDYLIRERGLEDKIIVLPSGSYPDTIDYFSNAELRPKMRQQMGKTFMVPLPGVAEDIPLPNNSVTKATMIHSAYEFFDVEQAMTQLARILTPDGLGSLTTNGSNDKLVFRSILERAGVELKNPPPQTVSSRLTHEMAVQLIDRHFDIVDVLYYMDDMVITENRKPVYINMFETYKNRFQNRIINDGRWKITREELLDKVLDEAIEEVGYALDSIDIATIYFKVKK